MIHEIHFPDAPPKRHARPYAKVSLPYAKISAKQAPDGRWMWAVDVRTSVTGTCYAPLEKWGRFAPTQDKAIEKGVAEAMTFLTKSAQRQDRQSVILLNWLASYQLPVQQGLF